MQCLEVSGAVRPIYGSLGVKRLIIERVGGGSSLSFVNWDPKSSTLSEFRLSREFMSVRNNVHVFQ